MKKRRVFLGFTMLMLLISGCSNQTDNPVFIEMPETESVPVDSEIREEGIETVSFTDALGRRLEISNPQRVVTLLGSFCDEWLLAGGSVVGTVSDTFTNYDFHFDESVEDIGSHMEPDVERIISLNPDSVIASTMMDSQVELLDTLENAGITVAYFNVTGFEDYPSENWESVFF